MLSTVPASTYVGVSSPLQNQISQHRLNVQILTNDFERLHTRSVEGVGESRGTSALKITPHADRLMRASIGTSRRNPSAHARFKSVVVEGSGRIRSKKAATAPRPTVSRSNAPQPAQKPTVSRSNAPQPARKPTVSRSNAPQPARKAAVRQSRAYADAAYKARAPTKAPEKISVRSSVNVTA